jgi:hypothetical protein
VPGTVVSLLAPDSQTVVTTVVDDSGRFQLQAPEPGPYRLRAQRIGYMTTSKRPAGFRHCHVSATTIGKYLGMVVTSSVPKSNTAGRTERATSFAACLAFAWCLGPIRWTCCSALVG